MAVARVLEFTNKLQSLTEERDIKILCEAELAYLREALGISWVVNDDGIPTDVVGSVTGLHTQLTRYRNAVKKLELTPPVTNSYIKGRSRINEHIALKYLVKADIEKLVRGESDKSQKVAKQKTRRFIDCEELLAIAEELLSKDSYLALAAGLMLVTGRRASEVLKTAEFKKISDYSVEFSGQLKTRGAEGTQQGSYTIPVLLDADKVVSALDRLRELRDFTDLSPSEVHSKVNKSLNETVKRYFKDFLDSSKPKPKDLRAAYAAMTLHSFYDAKTMMIGEDEYLARILGHGIDDIATAQSYKDFSVL